ncbi:MAG TPA: ATP-binding protein [Croceibacterium sp.]
MTLLRSLSFRLALLYLAVFAGSVALLGGLFYWIEVARPLAEIRGDIRSESAALSEFYRGEDPAALTAALEARAVAEAPRVAYHALLNSRGEPLTANLPSWPGNFAPGWKRIEADVAREGDEDEYEALVLDQQLPGGLRLLLGRDIDDIDELEESLSDTVLWIVPALLLLGVCGGALMSRVIAARLDAISSAARGVIDGDLSSRIELRGASDDFDRLAATLNLMLDRLEASLDAVRRVSDSVAHELRTPLARLQAELADLSASPAPEGAARALAEATRLQTVIDAVLRIARIEAGRHAMTARPVDLSALLADVIEFYQPEADVRGQQLVVSVAPGLSFAGDGDLLFQGFANLLDNAVKFTPDGGTIVIGAAEEGGAIQVEVRNDALVSAPEQLDRVTERFFRAPGAAGVVGLGLGLSLVAAIAVAHRSDLSFRSDEKSFLAIWRFHTRDG